MPVLKMLQKLVIYLCFLGFIICDDGQEEIPGLLMDLMENPEQSGLNCEGDKCWPSNLPLQRGPTCLDKRKILGLEESQDEFVIVEAFIGQDIQLDCHYCNERDDDVPKIWYYNDRMYHLYEREVPQHLELPIERRKFAVDKFHMLTIRNFSEVEGAIYFCQGLHDNSSKFNFIVDVVPRESGPEPNSGTDKEFVKYYKEEVKPINKALAKEHLTEIKNWFKVQNEANFDITYEWSSWGGCNACGRDKGSKRRHGKCRIAIPTPQNERRNETARHKGPLRKLKFGIQFSCQSLLLDRFLSEQLVKRIRKLADFVETAKCKGKCLLDLNIDRSWQEAKAGDKLETASVWKIEEQSLTLTCPRSDLESQVVWVKDGKLLSSKLLSRLNGRMIQTVKNELQFRELKMEDKGNYTCFVDNVQVFTLELLISHKENQTRDVSWIWTAFGIFSMVCFLIWMFLIIIVGRVSKRIQFNYKPLSQEGKMDAREFLKV